MEHAFDTAKQRIGDPAPAGRYTCRTCDTTHPRLDVSLHLRGGQMYFECGGCGCGWGGGCAYDWEDPERHGVAP